MGRKTQNLWINLCRRSSVSFAASPAICGRPGATKRAMPRERRPSRALTVEIVQNFCLTKQVNLAPALARFKTTGPARILKLWPLSVART